MKIFFLYINTSLNNKKVFLISFFALLHFSSNAVICTSTGNGNWDTPASWTCGREPVAGDTVRVLATHTITVNSNNTLTASLMVIIVNGILYFDGGKLSLHVNSQVIINPGGNIIVDPTNKGNDDHINIGGGTAEWTSNDGNLTGPWVITHNNSGPPLPVTYFSFDSKSTLGGIELHWSTLIEKNNSLFVIEKSEDAIEFIEIGRIESKSTNGGINYYMYTDKNINNSHNYYKIKQIDEDGTFSYSKTIFGHFEEDTFSDIKIYPNPSEGKLFVNFPQVNGKLLLKVSTFDNQGKLIMEKEYSNTIRKQPLNVEESLSPGIYLMHLQAEGLNKYQKIVIK